MVLNGTNLFTIFNPATTKPVKFDGKRIVFNRNAARKKCAISVVVGRLNSNRLKSLHRKSLFFLKSVDKCGLLCSVFFLKHNGCKRRLRDY